MPEQPNDPLHYDMKIPPETHPSDDDRDSDRVESDSSATKTESAKDSNVVRGDDKPQAVRQSGRND